MRTIKKNTLYILDAFIYILLISVDRLSKYFVYLRLKDHPTLTLFNDIFELKYIENTGAALGILNDQKYFFLMFATILLLISIYCIYKSPAKSKYIPFHLFIIFICAGSTSNSIDRLIHNFVIDFIKINKIRFPVFNVADIFITIGAVALVIIIAFFFKEDDLNFLRFNEKKIRDINT